MTIYLAPLCALIGVLMYALGNAKTARLGEITFFCGLLVTLMTMTTSSFKLH